MNKIDKSKLIIIVITSYITLMTGLYYGTNSYIQKKGSRLKTEVNTGAALDFFFKSRDYKYVDLYYNIYNVGYNQVSIPRIQQPSHTDILSRIRIAKEYFNKDESEEEALQEILENKRVMWEQKRYGQYSSLYDLDTEFKKTGWAFRVIERIPLINTDDKNDYRSTNIETGYYEYFVFPSQVAYKKNKQHFTGNIPNIETAVKEALVFLTNNDNSWLKDYFVKGSTEDLMNEMNARIDNKYYHVVEQGIYDHSWWEKLGHNDSKSAVDAGYMSKEGYEVLFKKTQPKAYYIKWSGDDVLEREKYIFLIVGTILLTIVMLIVVLPLWKKVKKAKAF